MMAGSIDSKTKRKNLKARREPYWHQISRGLHVGYRAVKQGEGSWIGKWRDDDGKRHYKALGNIPETDAAEAFDKARKEVEVWADQCRHGARPKGETVEEACELYVANRRTQIGDRNANDAEGRFKRLVYGTANES